MKKNMKLSLVMLTVALFSASIFGCVAPKESSSTASDSSAPALQPVDHSGRFENLGAKGCYGCHGSGDLANPNLTPATVLPEDHYLEGGYETKELDPGRSQCITCHPVAES